MGFSYIVELQNIDTDEKFIHPVHSLKKDHVFNDKEEINYQSIVQFILMYEPQCERNMLLIMYQQSQQWLFMTSEFSFDLRRIFQNDQILDKTKISKFGSKISSSNSHFQSHIFKSNKQSEKNKIILSVRFQCQLWVDESQTNIQKNLINQKSLHFQKDARNFNLMENMKQIKKKVNQIEQFSHELHEIQAQALGVNIFWANPYYSTDGINRKYIADLTKKKKQRKQENQDGKKQYLKNSVKCIPYVNTIAQQIKQSNKKIVLNIDQFNRLSFARRNIFNVVYLVCHAQVAEIKKNQYQQKFRRNSNQVITDYKSQESDYFSKIDITSNTENVNDESGKIDSLDYFVQTNQQQEQLQNKASKFQKLKKCDSFIIDADITDQLQEIDEQKQSDNMTERKQSVDYLFIKDNQEIIQSHSNQQNGQTEGKNNQLLSSKYTGRNDVNRTINQKSQLQNAFNFGEENNVLNILMDYQFEYDKQKQKKSNVRRNKLSRSNSVKSVSSKSNKKSSRSKSKKSFKADSLTNIAKTYKKQSQQKQHPQFNVDHSTIARSKKYHKKLQKKGRYYKKEFIQGKQKQNIQKQAVTYLVGQNKWGELQKITPQDLDDMLKERKLQNIELFVIHTSYPYSHLQVLRRHANNILVINSNPMYPEACTFFFLKYFFRHLFQTKNIQTSYQKALIQTSYLYRGQSNEFFELKFSNLYYSEKQSLQRLNFDPVMQNINKRYVHGGSYTCCCYHKHQDWCIFKKNKTTSKFADAHYKFHVNRCNCHFSNIMVHSCPSKFRQLGIYNIIDKKNYNSTLVYNCCCLGVKVGKYKQRKKNKQYIQTIQEEGKNDPHEVANKYLFLPTYQPQRKQKVNLQQTIINPEKLSSQNLRIKNCLQIQDGTVQGSYTESFQSSMKYIFQNDLLGNSQIIVELLQFFGGKHQGNAHESQVQGDIQQKRSGSKISNQSTNLMNENKKPLKVTNSMIRQSMMANSKSNEQRSQIKKIHEKEPWICNMHGQNSSGRKTISKYLAHLMVVKKMFEKVAVILFSKVEDLKFIQIDQQVPTFYILIYKSTKRNKQIDLDHITLSVSNLPASIKCIIVTNKKIVFDKIIKCTDKTPKPLDKEEIKTYIKMYEHLSSQEKNKLNNFMDLSDLNPISKKEPQEEDQQRFIKIYANQIDSYEIISIVRQSNYKNPKYTSYLESVSKIHSISLPCYIFITGIIFKTLKQLSSSSLKFVQMKKQNFTQSICLKLKDFMIQNKAFYLFFDPKRNKNKTKKQIDNKKINILKQVEAQQDIIKCLQNLNIKQNQNQQQKYFKEQIIKSINISEFYTLLFQKFRKQISSRSLDALKFYIYYTSIQQNGTFSLKNSYYQKGNQNLYYRNLSSDKKQYRTRQIVYETDFYEATSLNRNSFLYKVLFNQINQYGSLFNEDNDKKATSQQRICEKPIIESVLGQNKRLADFLQKDQQINNQLLQHQKKSLNQFFSSFVQILKEKNHEHFSRIKSMDCQIKQTNSSKQINLNVSHTELTPKKQYHQSNEHGKHESFSLPHKERKRSNFTQKQKIHSNNQQKSKGLDFEQEQKHLHYIMSAGLSYLRSVICSHLIYNQIKSTQLIIILKAALILINNALILMKTPHFRYKTKSDLHLQNLNSNADDDSIQSQSYHQSNYYHQQSHLLDNKKIEKLTLLRNKSQQKEAYGLGMSQPIKFKVKDQGIERKQNMEKELKNLFSVKGLLYLLFKIRERCDGLILTLTNRNSKQQVTKLSIISELLSLQIHLANIYKGENYEEAILKSKNSQRVEKYLASIFYDKGRSLNYLKGCFRLNTFNSDKEQTILNHNLQKSIQNHILSIYLMIATNCGRKKINDILCREIIKIKNEFQQKPTDTKDSNNVVFLKKTDFNNLSSKMKILFKISQNQQIFRNIQVIFMKFQFEKICSECQNQIRSQKCRQHSLINYRQCKKFGSNISIASGEYENEKSNQSTKVIQFNTQTELYLRLLDIWHDFEQLVHNESTDKLYVSLQKYRIQLENKDITHSLRFCTRNINDFYLDLLQKIKNQISPLKDKLILFLSADPIQSNKLYLKTSSKERHLDYTDDWELYNKKIQYQANNKTIILDSDINCFNLKEENQNLIVNHTTKSNQQIFLDSNHTNIINKQKYHQKLYFQTKQPYKYFSLKRKLNEGNFKELSESSGCKYLYIDSTMCVNDQRNEIIGQSEEGQMIIFKKQHLFQLISSVNATVYFIGLHNNNLANQLINKQKKKQIVYFNFEKITNEILEKNSSIWMDSSSGLKQKQIKTDLLYTYYRMIMRKVVNLIIQKIVKNTSDQGSLFKLHQAFKQVATGYEFKIKNQSNSTVFYLSNQQLNKSLKFTGIQSGAYFQKNNVPILINLSKEDIVSVEQVQQVKSILKHKKNNFKQFKTPIPIRNIKSFQKLFKIFQLYLKDKQHYQQFFQIDLDDFRNANKDSDGILDLELSKSNQSSSSLTLSLSRYQSKVSNDSAQRKKNQRKHKQTKGESVKYLHKWKSQFVNYLMKKNILNLFLSNKKCFFMFSNSDLMNQKGEKQQWAKIAFDNLFKIDNYDTSEELHRVVSEVKVGIPENGNKKISKIATLFFIETKTISNQ